MEENKPKVRVLELMLLLLGRPFQFTKRDLAMKFGKSPDTIKRDLMAIRSTRIKLDYNPKTHRYAIIPDYDFPELKFLQLLTEEEKNYIMDNVGKGLTSHKAKILKKKLENLYDFQQLGLSALRRPNLERIDSLEHAMELKKQVVLESYMSNSNAIGDRLVEVFHIDAELDTIQGYDVEKQAIRHFRLSRIERVKISEHNWTFEEKHHIKATDVFGIADDKQLRVHLELDIYARNILVETYPKARAKLMPCADPHKFDFSGNVNHQFIGIKNFIMSNWRHITVLNPRELQELVIQEAKDFLEKLEQM